jgi:hypothetical protein
MKMRTTPAFSNTDWLRNLSAKAPNPPLIVCRY